MATKKLQLFGSLSTELPDHFSQGRSAEIKITTPGWKRVLNIIRAHGGSLNLGVGKANANYGYAFQVLGLEFTGNVNFPGTTSAPIDLDTQPIIYQRFCHEMGENNAEDQSRRARISKVRIGYPLKGTDYPDSERSYHTSPVNCYVDVFVDFDEKVGGTPALLVNYAGFTVSNNCESIIEEVTVAEDAKGMYGETLEFYEFIPNKDADLYLPDGSIETKELHADNMPFEKMVGTADEPIILRDLPTGCYYLNGRFRQYNGGSIATLAEGLYVVTRTDDVSCVLRLATSNMSARYYTIYDDSYDKAREFKFEDIESLKTQVGDIDTALDSIIAIQEELIGGDA